MGPAHSIVKNQTESRICVITFTYTDLIYLTYNTLYVIEPGATILVESQPDATGLKVGLVYDCSLDTKELFYQRFVCKTDSTLTISEIDGEEISWFGENITGYTKGKIKETNKIPLTMAYEAVQNVEPTVGNQNGKFEKELIKRVISETKDKKNEAKGILPEHIIEALPDSKNNSRHGSGGSSTQLSATKQQPKVDDRSVAEKWEQEQERILQAAQKEQGRLADNKATVGEALAKVLAEEELAREMEKKRAEEEKRSEKARRDADKIRREQELDDAMETKKGKKRKNKKGNEEGGCIIV